MDWVAPGVVLAGKFALEKKLGQGGMGAVWRAEHLQLKSPVAIKLIDEQIASSPDALNRFMREAQSAAALRSPHVVQILDFGADRGVPYIAMELLDGESLADRLARVGRMSPQEIAGLMTQVARALGKAHEMGIVHRDIKPDNIFIVRNDEEDVAKVLDFGIAKSSQGLGVGSGSTTRTGAILGTPNYMSPEQAEGTKLVDHRTDLWALGVIVFEALVGRKPFDSDALGSLLLAICTRPIPVPSQWGYQHPGFDAWFARACAREVGERFQSARELTAALRQICGIHDMREPSPSAHGPTVRALSSPSQMTPYPHSQGSHGSAVTPNVPLPTANTYSASVDLGVRKKPIAALVIVGLFASAALAAGVAFFVRKSRVDVAEETAAKPAVEAAARPAAEAVEKPAAPIVTPAPAPTPLVIPAPAPLASEAPVASAQAATTATPAAPGAKRPRTPPPAKKPPPGKIAAPTPAPAPAPAPEPKAPEPKPTSSPNKVNLGI
ncbi:MAG TPA: serine/threonine-protein kinase [Polyangiaceae bacterium]